jgi:D-glycero-D-manno-heptose 1,7-bisphosphate phosphatase
MNVGPRRIVYTPPAAVAPGRACAFLDRDGVLNIDHGHVHTAERFDWIAGAQRAARRLTDLGYLIVVATNQSGIARGLYDDATFKTLSDWMAVELTRAGARIDAVYYCPHHPTAGLGDLLAVCACRKPAPGMLTAALADYRIDAARSFFIGDKDTDVEAAAAAGLRGLKFPGDDLDAFVRANAPAVG